MQPWMGWEWEQKARAGTEMICFPFKALKQGQVKNEPFKQPFTKTSGTIMGEQTIENSDTSVFERFRTHAVFRNGLHLKTEVPQYGEK